MALKRRNRVEATFAMSSMTDLIFLLLLFFVMASTMSSPNDIKINLPQSRSTAQTKPQVAKVSIDADGIYYLAIGNEMPEALDPSALEPRLVEIQTQDTGMIIALHADQDVKYSEIVRVLDIANANNMKLVVATHRRDQIATKDE